MQTFDYDKSFSRYIGWATAQKQVILRNERIAVAGMSGVGGFHLLSFARLSVGKFYIADLDTFEAASFNRQVPHP
jgi:tRNA A37 threonylcarbamoyladenosine dehydratase